MTNERADVLEELIVKLKAQAVGAESPSQRALRDRLARLGAALEPLHPATSDADLATYAVVRVRPDQTLGVLENLRSDEGVEAAYVKPRGEPARGA